MYGQSTFGTGLPMYGQATTSVYESVLEAPPHGVLQNYTSATTRREATLLLI